MAAVPSPGAPRCPAHVCCGGPIVGCRFDIVIYFAEGSTYSNPHFGVPDYCEGYTYQIPTTGCRLLVYIVFTGLYQILEGYVYFKYIARCCLLFGLWLAEVWAKHSDFLHRVSGDSCSDLGWPKYGPSIQTFIGIFLEGTFWLFVSYLLAGELLRRGLRYPRTVLFRSIQLPYERHRGRVAVGCTPRRS